jgi:glutathione peroxidase
MKQNIYDITCVDLMGAPLPMQQFEGRPIIIVNTASLCGFAPQLTGLESVWRAHRDAGLVVLGVPSNDFGHQEPGDSKQVVSLCVTKFGVTFPMLAKTPVKGRDAHPLFRWLADQGGAWSRPRWNFYKYVVGRDGRLKNWFLPLTTPGSARFEKAVTTSICMK